MVAKAENLLKFTVHVHIAEECLKTRRALTRGVASLRQLTGLHFFHNANTVIPEKKRVHYSGTNLGSVVGPVEYESWGSSWKLSLDTKKLMYAENRKPVGGRSDGTEIGDSEEDDDHFDDDSDKPKFTTPVVGGGRGSGAQRGGQVVEPVFWHQLPSHFYKDLFVSYWGKTIIDLTAGGGLAAQAALELQLGYTGFAFTDEHRQLLTDRLTDPGIQSKSILCACTRAYTWRRSDAV